MNANDLQAIRERLAQSLERREYASTFSAIPSVIRRDDEISALLAHVDELREALTVAAKAELYDPATGIIDADVLEAVQDVARRALGPTPPQESK